MCFIYLVTGLVGLRSSSVKNGSLMRLIYFGYATSLLIVWLNWVLKNFERLIMLDTTL